jgi:uncharacterized membrane protein
LTVTLFTRKDCPLCEQAKEDLLALQESFPHQLVEVDIDTSPDLVAAYGSEIPVVEVGPFKLRAPFDRQQLQKTLGAGQDRKRQLEEVEDSRYQARLKRGQKISDGDRFSFWFGNHYLLVFNLLVFLYVGLPFLAPMLMRAGAETPAMIIYRVYGSLCHQLSYRSWFLFGEQSFYPRAAAGIDGYLTFNQTTGLDETGLVAARQFVGNEVVGYKVALCQRDVAIYGAILLFGLLFGLTGRRWRPLPIWLWFLLGLVPIGLDGVSQLLSQMVAEPGLSFLQPLAVLLPYRESTPFLRTLTGFLFGFMTAWFGYPLVEETMAETRQLLSKKFIQVKNLNIQR